MPTLVTGRASDVVWRADRASGPFLDEVERVQPGPQFVAHDQVDDQVGFGRGAGVEVSCASLRDQVERLIRRGGTPVQSQIQASSARLDDVAPVVGRVALPRDGHLAANDARRPPQRLGEEIGVGQQNVHEAEARRLIRAQHAVLVQRIVDDDT